MQNNPVHRKNIQALQSLYPEILAGLKNDERERTSYRKIITETGLPSIEVIKNHLRVNLSSIKDPLREAKRIAVSSADGTEEIVVIVGLGLGYHIEEMLRLYNEIILIIIEPSSTLFHKILEARDISAILNSKRVRILLDPDSVDYNEISPHPSASNIKLIITRPYLNLYPEKIKRYEGEFYSFLNSRQINIATLKRFDKLWTKNTFKNSSYFFSLKGTDTLRDVLINVPAVVTGAGPSLEKEMDLLREVCEFAVLISVDTTLKPLLKHGIMPDFAVTVDPQFINSFHLAFLPESVNEEKQLPILVADPAVYPATLRNYAGIKILSSSVFNPGKIIENFSGIKGSIAAGGSVSTTAFDLARTMGADPIILMGLDLSYRCGKTHLGGSFIEEYAHSRITRFTPADSLFTGYVREGKPSHVKNKEGETVISDRRMLLYKSWFEYQVKGEKRNVLNATRGGLSIDGVKDIEPACLLQYIQSKAFEKKKVMANIHARLGESKIHPDKVTGFIQYLFSVRKNLFRLQKICSQAAEIVRRLRGAHHENGFSGREKQLNKLDAIILSFKEENRLISMVMQSPINDILAQHDVRKDEALSNSLKLYSAIDEASCFLADLLSLSIKKLKKVIGEV